MADQIIPNDQVTLDPQPQAAPDSPASAPEIDPSQVQIDADPYATPLQTGIAHAEAAGRGLVGPLATLGERMLGVPKEDIKAREAANPEAAATEAATFGVSALTGVGEAALVGKIGAEAAKTAEATSAAGKIARAALRSGVETALVQSGDEVHRMILGDPASASDVALAAGMGLVGGAALESVPVGWNAAKAATVGKWLRTAGDAVVQAEPGPVNIAKKLGKGLFDIPEAATESYLKDVKGVQAASDDLWSVAEKLPKAVSDVGAEAKDLSKRGRAALTEVREIPSEGILDTLKSVPGKQAEKAVQSLEEELSARRASVDLKPGADNLTEREVRGAMDTIRKDVNWNAQLPTPEKAALRSAHGVMNDILRSRNPVYAEEIGQSAKNMSLKENLIKKLRLMKDYSAEHGFKATDTTVSRLKDLSRADKRDVADILTSLKELGHEDLATEVKNTLTKQAFEKDATRGSRLTLLGGATGAGLGGATGIPGAQYAGGVLGSWLGSMADRYGPKAYYDVLGKLAERAPEALGIGRLKAAHATLPLARAILSDESSASGAKAAVDYTAAVAAGESRMRRAVESAMQRGGLSLAGLKPDTKVVDKVKKAVDRQEKNPTAALETKNDLSRHMPENATSLVAAKTRVLSYLSTLKPKAIPALPFDDHQVDAASESRYERALQIAASPLSVLHHVQRGTLEPDQVKDLSAMYPPLVKALREKVFARMVDVKHKDEKPDYHVRQSLSLLMGTPLDSTFTPANMQAMQATYATAAAKRAQGQPEGPKKPGRIKSSLSKVGEGHATSDQAAATRSQGGY